MKSKEPVQIDLATISDANAAFRQLVADLGYDWPVLKPADKQEIANRLSGMVGQDPPWTWIYVQNVYQGMAPSKRFLRAFLALGAAFDGIPVELVKAQRVNALAVHPAHNGVLILAGEKQCGYGPCGIWFVPVVPWQKCHSRECSKKMREMKRNAVSIPLSASKKESRVK